ncbi:hypothetical protein SCHPADRAFT_895490 [Schizopora paradoxa]|uniref:Uncharacterized protein n=1 Tax=Schizopora paradoxa TaxID=27342 RepID=A0A0H2R3K2_9AGAM|nr:hypothetical protein SCHPADRAFT_895490 [Schizopora paradoxa]
MTPTLKCSVTKLFKPERRHRHPDETLDTPCIREVLAWKGLAYAAWRGYKSDATSTFHSILARISKQGPSSSSNGFFSSSFTGIINQGQGPPLPKQLHLGNLAFPANSLFFSDPSSKRSVTPSFVTEPDDWVNVRQTYIAFRRDDHHLRPLLRIDLLEDQIRDLWRRNAGQAKALFVPKSDDDKPPFVHDR